MRTSAKIIADSIGHAGARITTFEVIAPRFLLAEVNTHRMIARSAASSRAIPVAKRIQMVTEAPFVPLAFGRNRPGMQASEMLSEHDALIAESVWLDAAGDMVKHARKMADLGVHKQHANRLLEPFAYYAGVMTGTEWEWFFKLRNHEAAQPEFRDLAAMMFDVYEASKPAVVTLFGNRVHLPYVTVEEGMQMIVGDTIAEAMDSVFAVSAARCARISYRTFDGRLSTPVDDRELCAKLIAEHHLSPFDQPAIADEPIERMKGCFYWKSPRDHRQFWGWIPRRVDVERRLNLVPSRDSFSAIPADIIVESADT